MGGGLILAFVAAIRHALARGSRHCPVTSPARSGRLGWSRNGRFPSLRLGPDLRRAVRRWIRMNSLWRSSHSWTALLNGGAGPTLDAAKACHPRRGIWPHVKSASTSGRDTVRRLGSRFLTETARKTIRAV